MLCEFAQRFPNFVADFLNRDQHLRRRFREETVTDMIMAALVAIQPYTNLFVDYPVNEAATGNDMDWYFVEGGRSYHLMIQAKKLTGDGRIWSRHNYHELYHLVRDQFQADILCNAATGARAFPLYFFYNRQSSRDLAAADGVDFEGITYIDGYLIRWIVEWANNPAAPNRQTRRTRGRSLRILQPLFRPITHLLCPGPLDLHFPPGADPSIYDVPSPSVVRERIVASPHMASFDELSSEAFPVPDVIETPPDIASRIRRRSELGIGRDRRGSISEADESLERPRVIFVRGPIEAVSEPPVQV